MNTQYRQGDVPLVRFRPRRWGALTPVERAGGRIVLAEGEATGHAHVIDSPPAGLGRGGGRSPPPAGRAGGAPPPPRPPPPGQRPSAPSPTSTGRSASSP